MNTHADKTSGSKSQAVANSLQKQQPGTDTAFQLVDERPEAVAQRKMQDAINGSPRVMQLQAYQDMADNSTRVKQLSAHQAMADTGVAHNPGHLKTGIKNLSPVAQLVVDWAAVAKTAGNNYAVSADHTMLYSKHAAPDPLPPSMYTKGADTTNGDPAVPLRTWQPNVRFLSKATIAGGPRRENEMHGKGGAAIQFERVLNSLQPEYLRIKGEVKAAMEAKPAEGGAAPTMGIVGMNDCGEWASALQGLIAKTHAAVAEAEQAPYDLGKGDAPNMEGAPPVEAGGKMEQALGPGSASEHHGATVVATDGASLVTLEAHVEKDVPAPEFHIHQGLSGFVDSNNAGPAEDDEFLEPNGRRGTVTPIGEPKIKAYLASRMEGLSTNSAKLASEETQDKLEGIQDSLRLYEEVVPEVKAKSQTACFLTTACVSYRNLPDDCEELTVLRDFRDNYMSKLPEGGSLIGKYYEVAPGIVAAIDRSPKRRDIYEELYLILRTCVEAIKAGNHSLALQVYKDMVIKLHNSLSQPYHC